MISPTNTVRITGADAAFERAIRSVLQQFPSWFVRAARVDHIEVTSRPEVRQQVAMMEHGSRTLYVSPGAGAILTKALGHELAHGIDDNFGNPHWFTSTPEWTRIHRNQPYFDIDKYREEPLEYFADCFTKYFLLGEEKLKITNPDEVRFITTWVIPTLQKEFGS